MTMTKSEQVEEYTEAVRDLQHAKVALPVSVSDAKPVDFQTAAAKPALISQRMSKPDSFAI